MAASDWAPSQLAGDLARVAEVGGGVGDLARVAEVEGGWQGAARGFYYVSPGAHHIEQLDTLKNPMWTNNVWLTYNRTSKFWSKIPLFMQS